MTDTTPAGGERSRAPEGLGEAGFRALLTRFGSDGEQPETVYERLRRRLIAYMRLHLPAQADDLADLTLDRMAHRLHEGTAVHNVYLYALGIARLVIREAQTRFARERSSLEEVARLDAGLTDNGESEALLAALEICLGLIGKPGAQLILAYYAGSGAERIDKRRALAAQLGLSINALRNRALRLRESLERCAQQQLRSA
jgi:DNA-directed RNA polymerase specialized sigma24 family protein